MIRKILYIVCFAVILSSCKSTKEVTYIPNPIENAIHEYCKTDDVRGLIQHYHSYPDYRGRIGGYLQFDRSYEKECYKTLLEYHQLAQGDSLLTEFFNDIIQERECQVLTQLSTCTIEEIANYYTTHEDEKIFIKPAIDNTILSDVANYDYQTLRKLYRVFKDTDLANRTDSVYFQARKLIHAQLNKEIPQYFKSETKIVNSYKAYIKQELDQYTSEAIESIVSELLNNDLPEGKDQIDQLFYKVFRTHISSDHISQIVNSNLNECFSMINNVRTSYLNTLMAGEQYDGYKLAEKDKTIEYNVGKPNDSLYKLSELQNKTDWVGWAMTGASLVAGMMSYGLLSHVIDAVDIGRTVKNTSKEMEESKRYIQEFIKELKEEIDQSTAECVRNEFKMLNKEIKSSQNAFKSVIYENY